MPLKVLAVDEPSNSSRFKKQGLTDNMLNRKKYFFDDFTHTHYRELLTQAKSHYTCKSYHDDLDTNEPTLLWRHDVDFSMQEALNLAKMESEAGVKATYFLLPHSQYYNLLEDTITQLVFEIIAFGHDIGLHFDAAYYNIASEEELVAKLHFESAFISALFNVPIKVFSFHNPDAGMLLHDQWTYAGLINTYAARLKENFAYCSDSNGYWRFERMYDVISQKRPLKLQALTHPEWWTEKTMSPKEKIWRCIDKRAEKTKQRYVEGIEFSGRSVIDWE